MNDIKTKRIKELRKWMTIVLTTAAFVCFVLQFIVKDEDIKTVFLIVSATLFGAVLIGRLFKGSFGYKPTLEEIEEEQFGNIK